MELVFDNRKKRMAFSGPVSSLLRKMKARREEVVIKVNGKLAPETREIKPSDRVEIIRVVFGG